MRTTSSQILFSETQRFTQPWLWAVVIGIAVVVTVGMIASGGAPQPAEGEPTLPFWAIMAISVLTGPALLLIFRLEVDVATDALHIRFFPLIRCRIEYGEIARAYARTYSPLREYCGWGIRYGWKGGKAYNVKGNEGLQIEFRNGKKLLIGSQRAGELETAVRRAWKLGTGERGASG